MKIYINGPYPCLANWILLREENGKTIARDGVFGDEEVLDEKQKHYLLQLDGKHDPHDPLQIEGFSEEECQEYFRYFFENGYIRYGRKLPLKSGGFMYSLVVPKKKNTKSVVPRVFNILLMLLSVPIFLLGLYRMIFLEYVVSDQYFMLGALVGILIATIIHEMAHAIACVAYGGNFFEGGILWSGTLLPSGYVLTDTASIKEPLQNAQIDLAGIEMNFLLSGILYCLVSSITSVGDFLYPLSGAMVFTAFVNMVGALFNITFVEGIDGEHALSHLILGNGKKTIAERAKNDLRFLRSRKNRRKFYMLTGINGFGYMMIFIFIFAYQAISPLVAIVSILLVLEMFL